MSALARLFGRISPEAGKIVLVVLAAIALLAGLVIWFARHDAKVIDQHEQKEDAREARATLNAERGANARSASRREVYSQNEEQLRNVQAAAERDDPASAGRAVGPVTDAVADELRRQRKNQPPR